MKRGGAAALPLMSALLAASACDQPAGLGAGAPDGGPPDGGAVLLTGAAAEAAAGCGFAPDVWIPGAGGGAAASPAGGWSLRFGDSSDDGVEALAAGADGGPVVLSIQYGVVDFGTGAYALPTSCSTMLSAFSPTGALRWSRSVANSSPRLAVASDGSPFVALTSNAVASLAPDGQTKWVWKSTLDLDFQLGVSADALFVVGLGGYDAGVYAGTFQRLSFDGAPVWSFAFHASSWPTYDVSGTDEVAFAIEFTDTVVLGGQSFQSAGGADFIVAKLGADGKLQWARQFGSTADDGAPAVALAPDGSVVLLGFSSGALDLGSGPIASGGGFVTYLARLDAQGNTVAGQALASTIFGSSLRAAPSGQIVVAGDFNSSMTIQGTAVHTGAIGDIDFLVVETSPSLDVQKILHFGNGGGTQQLGMGIAVDAQGGVLLGGSFQGKLDLGAGIMWSAGGADAFLGRVQL